MPDVLTHGRVTLGARYGWRLLRHKWYVARAGVRTRAPWGRLLVHDLSKCGPQEFWANARYYYAPSLTEAQQAAYWAACSRHIAANEHHVEHWTRHRIGEEIPIAVVREMVADWVGASRTHDGVWPTQLTTWRWFCHEGWRKVLGLPRQSRLRILDTLVVAFGGSGALSHADLRLLAEIAGGRIDRRDDVDASGKGARAHAQPEPS